MTAEQATGSAHAANACDGVYRQQFTVAFSYPVHFTHAVFSVDNPVLARTVAQAGDGGAVPLVLVCVDKGAAEARPGLLPDLDRYFRQHAASMRASAPPVLVPGGEAAKNGWDDVRSLMGLIGSRHMCRHSYVLALGGGSVLDMVGFAASLVHRGLRLIRLPSTVLAQNDAGVGVKNGMNERHTKNFVGTFAPPFAVIDDFELLTSLSDRDWIGGTAEAFKVAAIKDADFFRFLCEHAVALRNRDQPAMERLVRRCAELHLDHIRASGDPFEFGSSRPLDFGHWAAHKLEVMSGHALGHGQAVAVGMAVDACYAARIKLLEREQRDAFLGGLAACGLPVWSPLLDKADAAGNRLVYEGLDQFREHLGGQLTLAMPAGIGRLTEINAVDRRVMDGAIADLKAAAS